MSGDLNKEGTTQAPNPTDDNHTKCEMTTKEAYFASLNAWVKNANFSQNAISLFPWYLMSNYPQVFQSQSMSVNAQQQNTIGVNVNQAAAGRLGMRILDENSQADLINRNGGYEYVIAPFWKRAFAEAIDIVLLLIAKVIVTFILINIFDIELGLDMNSEAFRKALDDDLSSFFTISMDFLSFSSDLIILEIITKIVVCINEALCTHKYNGATLGKAIMKLRILYVEAVLPLPVVQQVLEPGNRVQYRALLFPAQTPTFKRALMRSTAKNLIFTFLFPMCFLMIFFKNNRTAYDIATKTIVVEANPSAVLHRPR